MDKHEMGIESNDDCVEQKLGHCIINWKIEHYCLATCKDGWVIESPVFHVTGLYPATKWKLILNTTKSEIGNISRINFCLKRLDDDEVLHVRANWKTCLLDIEENLYFSAETEYLFAGEAKYNLDLGSVNCILNRLCPLQIDTLIVRCQLIVRHPHASREFTKASDIGLRSLSEDLAALYKCGKGYDIVFRLDGKIIQAHKAILKFRNDHMSDIIDRDDENVDEFPLVHYEAMSKVIAYLYTGNLEYVLEKPSISLYQCVMVLNIDEVQSYYAPDELIFHSTVDVQEFVFLWLIRDFSTRQEDYVASPVLNKDISDVSWKLRLYPKNIEGDVQYIAIFAESSKVTKPFIVCLEFAIMDTNRKLFCSQRVRKYTDCDEMLGFKEFVNKESLENSPLLADDTLRIFVKIRISNGVHTSSLVSQMMPLVAPNDKQKCYEWLSTDMMRMLQTGIFCDLVIIAEEKRFNVHKCIIAARSRVLSSMIDQVSGNEIAITIPNVKHKILQLVISYMYSGVLDAFETADVCHIYEASETLEISSLKDACSRVLKENVKVRNVLDILLFAENKGDENLKLFSLKFICLNTREVYDQLSWKTLTVTNPSLCAEIIEFVKSNQ